MPEPPTLRADARRNRDALIATARAAFAEQGLGASLDDIARRAGVGSGTLYRHFPTRDDLITAVFVDRMTENVAAVERALEDDDAWEAFAGYVRRTCREQAVDRGLADLMAIGRRGRALGALRNRAHAGFTTLIDRAQAAGALRADFTTEDVVLLLMANAGIMDRAGTAAAAASERFVALTLDGFRADGATAAPAAVSPRALIAALRRAR